MKTYCLVLIMSIFSLNAVGEIKNGYGADICIAEESMRNLTSLLCEDNNLTKSKERKIKESLRLAMDHIAYYRLTEQLIEQFRIIAPDLYEEINATKDKKGRPVDVHVKFVPSDATRLKSWGTTCISQSATDRDTYVSEYGENTVSVKVWTVSHALLVLSHELGHVKYQVPNLASYLEFHRQNYLSVATGSDQIGHLADDPSGASAIEYGKRYRGHLANYLKESKDRLETPLAMLEKIMRAMDNKKSTDASLAGL